MIEFLALQAMDGHKIYVNMAAIISISEPRVIGRLGTDKSKCIVSLGNGKYVAVIESCESIQKRLKGE